MAVLPDEIWTQILETGVRTARLTHRDLCCAAIACRRLNRLSGEPAIWSVLLALDFPQQTLTPTPTPSPKSTYKIRFERDKARRFAAWRRTVLNAESQVVVCRNNVKELESMMMKESERLKAAVEEVNNLERARRASVALNVWQPEVIRGRQKQIVEQCTVPIESRLGAVKMEVRLCKQQIATYSKAYNDQMRKLTECKVALTSLNYQPLQSSESSVTVDDCNVKQKKKRKRECPIYNCCEESW